MNCPACHFENPHGTRFCGNCASPLHGTTSCPACRFENPPGFKFCGECGELLVAPARDASPRAPREYTPKHLADKILRSRSALEGERKQVTVLFADVKGSMTLAEQVDPEEWHAVLDRFFQILADGVHRFEGTVNQYTGDGIMALFGAPIAHEDHAQRACYAALVLGQELQRYSRELRLARGMDFAVRMGINSGEVVVGRIGDDMRMDYTAQGHTVGLAQRLEQLAEPGRIYLCEATEALVRGYFELEDLGLVRLAGVREPVRVAELQGVGPLRTRLDASRARGLSHFVGRSEEMQSLETVLERAQQGSPQVVGIVAEAGAGKSRLCFEFLEHCRARGIVTYEAHGISHGKATPLAPILELYRNYFGIQDEDDARSAREKIAGRMVLLDEALREDLPLVFDFMGVPDPARPVPRMGPEARQRQLFAVMRRIVRLGNRDQPSVTLLEDLHWFDGASDTFLEAFVDAVQQTHGLLIVNFRPEYQGAWMRKSYYQQLSLLPLGPAATRELLNALLGSDPSLAGLAQRIHEQTAGNPFFIEEVVQDLLESEQLEGTRGAYRLTDPVTEIRVPESVQSLLAARIDRLEEREKRVLQTASVLGKTFAWGLLQRVADLPESELRQDLERLTAGEFLYEASIYPEPEYAFKHPLTQEVAYHSQLGAHRQRIHAAVARELFALHGSEPGEVAPLVAYHWERADETLEAARWHRRAAEWIGVTNAAEAVRHWDRVRSLAQREPNAPELAELTTLSCIQRMTIGFRLGNFEDEAQAIFEEGKRSVERSGSKRDHALLEYAISLPRFALGDLEGALRHAREAARLIQETDDPYLQAILPAMVSVPLLDLGETEEAKAILEEIFQTTRNDLQAGIDLWGSSSHIFTTHYLARVETICGDLHRARELLGRAVELARSHDDLENECWALSAEDELAELSGDLERGLQSGRQAVQLAERLGNPFAQLLAGRSLAASLLQAGKNEEAVEISERILGLARERRTALGLEPIVLTVLAEAQRAVGRAAEAQRTARQSLELAKRIGSPPSEGRAHLALARVALAGSGAENAEQARSALATAEAICTRTGTRNRRALVHLERARLAEQENDVATQLAELRRALDLFQTMNASLRVREVQALIAAADDTR
jgi:class 3 adenylate cyclase/tetratricopeptide (TPR) repeat protein